MSFCLDKSKDLEKINLLKADKNIFKELEKCYHSHKGVLNPYHHEDNCLEHTYMVYEKTKQFYRDDNVLQIAALLHDIGKPFARFIENDKAKFHNHESLGIFFAVDVLNKMELIYKEKIRVLELIQRHADSYKFSLKDIQKLYNQKKYDDVLKIRRCDMLGRIPHNFEDMQRFNEEMSIKIPQKIVPLGVNFACKCTLMVGPPCSGKSTYVKERVKKTGEMVLCRDDIIMELYPKNTYMESFDAADQIEVNYVFHERFKKLVFEKKDFIVDMTLVSVKARRMIMEEYKSELEFNAVVFMVPYYELLSRNEKRKGKFLDEETIKDFCKRFQMIYPGEGFKNVQYNF